jgi:hypothetical protein
VTSNLWSTNTPQIRRVCVRHVSVSVFDTNTALIIMLFSQIIIGVAVSVSVSCRVSVSVSVLHCKQL